MINSGASQRADAGSSERRRLLQALVGTSLAVPCARFMREVGQASAQSSDPKLARPQAGDQSSSPRGTGPGQSSPRTMLPSVCPP